MLFEWDEEKRKINIERHHIDFEEAILIYDDFVITAVSEQHDLAEERFLSIGLLRGLEIVVVFTMRGEKRRIISARRARKAERIKYHEELKKYQNRF
ncbi:MAG: BrnT family toxin [Synergistaceae bacterium]|nr:BrnT family toxin [Synergistaceae bacterium]